MSAHPRRLRARPELHLLESQVRDSKLGSWRQRSVLRTSCASLSHLFIAICNADDNQKWTTKTCANGHALSQNSFFFFLVMPFAAFVLRAAPKLCLTGQFLRPRFSAGDKERKLGATLHFSLSHALSPIILRSFV
jgi:hypothetical protein